MAATPNMDGLTFLKATYYGHIQDIGQVTKDMRRVLNRALRQGRVVKCFSLFPYLTYGCSNRKMTWVKTDSEPIDVVVDQFFNTLNGA